MFIGAIGTCAIDAKLAFDVWMDVDTFLSELAFREVRTWILRMEVLALFGSVIAIREVSTFDLLLIFLVVSYRCFSIPDVVLE
jgi:hypothetical protein